MKGDGYIMSMNSFVAKCSCKHEGQDKLYGNGNRLFNVGTKGGHCTVCGVSKDKPKDTAVS